MISDSKLIKISLIISVVGLIGIFLSSQYIIPETVKISEISENDLGEYLSIEGNVIYLDIRGNTTFVQISDGENAIKGVIFQNDLNKEIFEGDYIRVVGNIEIYKEEVEIIIKKIL